MARRARRGSPLLIGLLLIGTGALMLISINLLKFLLWIIAIGLLISGIIVTVTSLMGGSRRG